MPAPADQRNVATRYILALSALFAVAALGLGWAFKVRPRLGRPVVAGARSATAPIDARFGRTDTQALVEVAERALPSLVSIGSIRAAHFEVLELPQDNPFLRRLYQPSEHALSWALPTESPPKQALGSGVLVARDTILTTAHLIGDASRLRVTTSDGHERTAHVAGVDPITDLAALRLSEPIPQLPYLSFGDSSKLRPGQVVLALGSPPRAGQTVSVGVVAGKVPAELGVAPYGAFIRTDAAINAGNIGGALVDAQGRLVGIATSAPGAGSSIGFAIPSNMARPVLASLLAHGLVERGYLGVALQDLDVELARALGLEAARGVLVADVIPGSSAALAGVIRGDVLVAVDGRAVTSVSTFRNLVAVETGGERVKLELERHGTRLTVTATLAANPPRVSRGASAIAQRLAGTAGLELASLSRANREHLRLPVALTTGLLVEDVAPGSPAAVADVRAGDVLLELDQRPVATEVDVKHAWLQARRPMAALLFRLDRTMYTVIEPADGG